MNARFNMTLIQPPVAHEPMDKWVAAKNTDAFRSRVSAVEEMVNAAVEDYVNDADLCAIDEDWFPSQRALTGRFYIERVAALKPRGHAPSLQRLRVSCVCLGRDVWLSAEHEYLGLDIVISCACCDAPLELSSVDSFVC